MIKYTKYVPVAVLLASTSVFSMQTTTPDPDAGKQMVPYGREARGERQAARMAAIKSKREESKKIVSRAIDKWKLRHDMMMIQTQKNLDEVSDLIQTLTDMSNEEAERVINALAFLVEDIAVQQAVNKKQYMDRINENFDQLMAYFTREHDRTNESYRHYVLELVETLKGLQKMVDADNDELGNLVGDKIKQIRDQLPEVPEEGQ